MEVVKIETNNSIKGNEKVEPSRQHSNRKHSRVGQNHWVDIAALGRLYIWKKELIDIIRVDGQLYCICVKHYNGSK